MAPKRTAIQEWVKWQLITIAVFLIDGSVYAFKYPYLWFPSFNITILGAPLSAWIGLATSLFIFIVETDIIENPLVTMNFPRTVLYAAAAVGTANQLTNANQAAYLAISAFLLAVDSATSAGPELPK
ncbi:hypothetical protein EDD86DRAFT_196396 [Gorgonomyces haynaldii]|nr:hypothetical protein EDD86DRAFT_196396 [Gorgonomyces haynaldii]